MKKSVVALTTAAILAGSAATYAVAQQQPAPDQTTAEDAWRPSPADRAAFVAARVAMLHARLALTPEQEKLWPPVEAVLKDIAQKREARWEQRREERRALRDSIRENKDAPKPDAIERLRKGAEFMAEAGNDLKRLADAVQPLYATLDDSQKRRLAWLVRHRGMGGMVGMQERMGTGWGGMGMGMGMGMMGLDMGEHFRERRMYREGRGRYHWRDRDDNDRRGQNQDRDDDQDDNGSERL